MGHRLQRHEGGCRYPHGHNYEAEVTVEGVVRETGPSAGMVLDFSALDHMVRGVLYAWDHGFMVEESDPFLSVLRGFAPSNIVVVNVPPTAENIAQMLAEQVQSRLGHGRLIVRRVRVHEGPKSVAEVVL